MSEQYSTQIPLASLLVDYAFNVRSKHGKKGEESYRGIEALAKDIQRDGQLVPVIVRPVVEKDGDPPKYQLVAGFRRYEAVRSLDNPTILASVMNLDDVKASLVNIKENVARDNLTSYDLAKRCVELRDSMKLSQAKIASELAAGQDFKGEGMSRSYIGNLMRAFDSLHPKIKEAWKNEDPSLSLVLLIKWGAMDDQDEQMEAWNELRGVEEGEEPDDEKSDAAPKKSARKASSANLVAALRAVKNDPKLSETVQDAMLAVFAFALGKKKTLSVGTHIVFDPKAKKEKAKKEKIAEETKEE